MIALRPCVKSDTIEKGSRTGGAGIEASTCKFKGRTKFLLIAATLASRGFPSLRILHSQEMGLSHSEGLRMQASFQVSFR